MIGSNRINGVALLGSCAGNALILGGIAWSLTILAQPRPPAAVQRPLVVELLPLHATGVQLAHADAGMRPAPLPANRVSPPPATRTAIAVPAQQPIAPGVGPVAAPSAGLAAPGAAPVAPASLLSDYQRRLRDLIASNTRYPAEARRARLSGVTSLAFRLARSGRVLESWVLHSSGSIELDTAALDALERAQPLIPIPAGLPDSLNFVVEIDSSAVLERSK